MGSDPLAERIIVVLVQPQHPGNVGSAARAMRNMGLDRLVLVDPPAWDPEQARWMAPGCDDLLARTRVVATLDEALIGVHTAVATTARHRRRGQPVIEPSAFAADAVAATGRVTALLFGREDHGLAEADVLRCASIVRIPTPEYASLNLAQAVLLMGWALFEADRARGTAAPGRLLGGTERAEISTAAAQRRDRRDRPADLPTIEPLVEGAIAVLDRVGYLRGTAPEKVRATLRGGLQRMSATIREVEAFRGMVGKVGLALDR